MANTPELQTVKRLVGDVEQAGIISGTPGIFSADFAKSRAEFPPEDQKKVNAAIAKSNASAKATKVTTTKPVSSNTDEGVIGDVIKDINAAIALPALIKRVETGATSQIHWWGWEVVLTNDGAQALDQILTGFVKDAAALLTALAGESAVLGAIGGVISIVDAIVEPTVKNGIGPKGEKLDGYAWVVIEATKLS